MKRIVFHAFFFSLSAKLMVDYFLILVHNNLSTETKAQGRKRNEVFP